MPWMMIIPAVIFFAVLGAVTAYDPPKRKPDWRHLTSEDRAFMWRLRDGEHFSNDDERALEAARLRQKFVPYEEFILRRIARGVEAKTKLLARMRRDSQPTIKENWT